MARVLLLGLKEVKGRALGHEKDRGKLELTLDREVLDRKVLLPIVGESLVEGTVLLLGHLFGLPSPDGLLLVHQVPLVGDLLDLLLLLVLLGLLLLLLNLLNLGLIAVVTLLLIVIVVIVVHLLVDRLLSPEGDLQSHEETVSRSMQYELGGDARII